MQVLENNERRERIRDNNVFLDFLDNKIAIGEMKISKDFHRPAAAPAA